MRRMLEHGEQQSAGQWHGTLPVPEGPSVGALHLVDSDEPGTLRNHSKVQEQFPGQGQGALLPNIRV
ncbi:hypothetical protein ACTMU2_08525 [Cupriavidus basilensis]